MFLCLGSFFNILFSAVSNGITQTKFLNTVCNIIQNDYEYDDSLVGHLKSGRNNLPPEDIELCRNKHIDDLIIHFRDNVIPIIRQIKQKNIVLALIDVLRNDNTISNEIVIGKTIGFTKENILSSNKVDFPAFLSNYFYYVVTEVDNKLCGVFLKQFNKKKDYIDSFEKQKDSIYFENEFIVKPSPLSMTVKSSDFENVFIEVPINVKIPLKGNSTLKLFHLNVVNNTFQYSKLEKFIVDNIDKYMFSRMERREYEADDRKERLTYDAMKKINRKDYDLFSEIMVYSFLETCLHAPKIASSFELKSKEGLVKSKTSGIHLLVLEKNNIKQFIMNSASTKNNITDAINSIFTQIEEIIEKTEDEYQIIESTIFSKQFDLETTEYLKQLIIPSKNKKTSIPETSFGVFICYTINTNNFKDLQGDAFRKKVAETMRQDIEKNITNILEIINKKSLYNYSFYFYFLPLSNAEIDSKAIIDNL